MKKYTLFIFVLIGLFVISSVGVVVCALNTAPDPIQQPNVIRPLSKAINELETTSNYTLDINIKMQVSILNTDVEIEWKGKIKKTAEATHIVLTIGEGTFESSSMEAYIVVDAKGKKTYYEKYGDAWEVATSTEELVALENLDILASQNIGPKNFSLENDVYYANLDRMSSIVLSYLKASLLDGTEELFENEKVTVSSFTTKLLAGKMHSLDIESSYTAHSCDLREEITLNFTHELDYSRIGDTRVSLPNDLPTK